MAAVPRELLPALEEEGLEAAAPGRLGDRLDRVDGILAHLPDLSAIVSDVVAALHPLAAEPGYDISHSQPRWRSRIFVSFPERDDEVGALRLAESVVHEAMHLHLTNEEARTPLVAKSLEHSYSPWRGTARAVGGVLHGMFVFVCIRTFLSRLEASSALGTDAIRHLRGRMECINLEVHAVDVEGLVTSMTPYGVSQIRAWARQGTT